MTENNRIAKWDNLRLLLIFCVVLGHAVNYLAVDADNFVMRRVYLYIYLFHMPAFIFLSGLFAKKAVKNYRFDKAFTFLLLYFVIKFALFLTRIAFLGYVPFALFATVGVDWYAMAMFLFYLMTMFAQRFDKRYVIAFALIFGCMIGYDKSISSLFVLGRVCSYYIFFVLGFYSEPERLLNMSKKLWAKVAAVVILAVVGVVIWKYYKEIKFVLPIIKGFPYRRIQTHLRGFGALFRLASYAAATLMTFALVVIVPSARCFLSTMGSRTMSIYAFHYCIIIIADSLFGLSDLLVNDLGEGVACLVIVLLSAACVTVFSLKPFDWLIRRLVIPPLVPKEEKP